MTVMFLNLNLKLCNFQTIENRNKSEIDLKVFSIASTSRRGFTAFQREIFFLIISPLLSVVEIGFLKISPVSSILYSCYSVSWNSFEVISQLSLPWLRLSNPTLTISLLILTSWPRYMYFSTISMDILFNLYLFAGNENNITLK